MPDKCVAYGCSARYAAEDKQLLAEGKPLPSLFKPTPEMLKIWEAKISRKNWKMKPTDRLCERHFQADDIIDSFAVEINGEVIKQPLKKRLKKGAIPVFFSLKEPPKPKRKAPAVRSTPVTKKAKISDNQVAIPDSTENTNRLQELDTPNVHIDIASAKEISVNSVPENQLTFGEMLFKTPNQVELPSENWVTITKRREVAYIHITDLYQSDRYILFSKDCDVAKVFINNKEIASLQKSISNFEELHTFLKDIDSVIVCRGSGAGNENAGRSSDCCHIIEKGQPPRCQSCFKHRKALQRNELRKNLKKVNRIKKSQKTQNEKKKVNRVRSRIKTLEDKLHDQMEKYRTLQQEKIDTILAALPPKQRLSVQACISLAKAKSSKGRRYTKEWMYECILMRCKGPALYRKMQQDNILPLPSPRTIQRYLKKMKPAYGFQRATFDLLSEKAETMNVDERHGSLLLDEMKLTEGLTYNKATMEVEGFINMDEHTPDEDKNKTGDHALVIMFQPFKGIWLQTVGAMLTRGAAKGKELAKIVLDAMVRLEQCGLFVDVIVSDGASWNRTMWAEMGMLRSRQEKEVDENEDDIMAELETEEEWELGIPLDYPFLNNTSVSDAPKNQKRKSKPKPNKKKSQRQLAEEHRSKFVSVEHPIDSTRRLWFASDFPHLVKSIKERILKQEILKTPDGIVRLSHWKRLYDVDSVKGIRLVPKLTADHFAKEGFLIMKVHLAYSFFSEEVAVGMAYYSKEKVSGLEDVTATVCFIRRINKLIEAMDARCPFKSLREAACDHQQDQQSTYQVTSSTYGPQSKKESREFVEEFLMFLKQWEDSKVKRCNRLSSQTAFGMRVTLSAALEITSYLSRTLGYSYFMTKRLSQDPLEHFFGKVRQSCGAGSHPTPIQFIQIYRLLSVASLIKPPRGSNITGAEMLDSLLKLEDVWEAESRQKRIDFEASLDAALDSGEVVDEIERALGDHLYAKDYKIEEKAVRYFSGYVARKARKTSTAKYCDECFSAVCAPDGSENKEIDEIIIARSKGHLLIPSDDLFNLIMTLEKGVVETVRVKALTKNIIFTVLEHIKNKKYKQVGCEQHKSQLTKDIVRFYLNTRIIFACEEYNRVQSDKAAQRRKSKHLQKLQRLAT